MNSPAVSKDYDIVPRVREGIELAKKDGFDYVFIVEDDDFYAMDYFFQWNDLEKFQWDFVGYTNTIYYNLRNRTWQKFEHPDRSSLFCTGFKISALDKFVWPKDNYRFLDIKLWDYCMRSGKSFNLIHTLNPNIGIKTGMGLCGGKGHVMEMVNKDPDLGFLQAVVDDESFEFYKTLKL